MRRTPAANGRSSVAAMAIKRAQSRRLQAALQTDAPPLVVMPTRRFVAFVGAGNDRTERGARAARREGREHALIKQSLAAAPELHAQWRQFGTGDRHLQFERSALEQLKTAALVDVVVIPDLDPMVALQEIHDIGQMTGAIKEYSPDARIRLHLPYLHYSRSDRADTGTIPTLRTYVGFLETLPVDQFIVYDLHNSGSIPAFHSRHSTAIEIRTEASVARFISQIDDVDWIVAADPGQFKYCDGVAKLTGIPVDNLLKRRDGHSASIAGTTPRRPHLAGQVVALIDDESQTGTTLMRAVEALEDPELMGVAGIHIIVGRNFMQPDVLNHLVSRPSVRSFASTELAPGHVVPFSSRVPHYMIPVNLDGIRDGVQSSPLVLSSGRQATLPVPGSL